MVYALYVLGWNFLNWTSLSNNILFQSIVKYSNVQYQLRVQRISQNTVFYDNLNVYFLSMYMIMEYYCIWERG